MALKNGHDKKNGVAVRALQRELREHSKRDQQDHALNRQALQAVSTRLDGVTTIVTNTGEKLGVLTGQLAVLSEVLKEDREARAAEHQVKVEHDSAVDVAEKKAELEDKNDKKSARRRLLIKVITVTGTIAATLAGGAVHLIHHC